MVKVRTTNVKADVDVEVFHIEAVHLERSISAMFSESISGGPSFHRTRVLRSHVLVPLATTGSSGKCRGSSVGDSCCSSQWQLELKMDVATL